MGTVKMCLEGCGRRWVVEVNVEEELLIRVWKALTEFTLNCAVTRTDMVLQDVTDDSADIFNLGELRGGPVV